MHWFLNALQFVTMAVFLNFLNFVTRAKDRKQIWPNSFQNKNFHKKLYWASNLLIFVKFDFVLLIKTFVDVVAPKGAVLWRCWVLKSPLLNLFLRSWCHQFFCSWLAELPELTEKILFAIMAQPVGFTLAWRREAGGRIAGFFKSISDCSGDRSLSLK